MEELLYDAKTLANIIIRRDMSIKSSHKFLSDIWEYDKEYLYLCHRFSKKQFILDVMDEVNYWQNKKLFDEEFISVNHDFEAIGSDCRYFTEDTFDDIRSFFMELRLRIIFLDNQDFVRMKLRTVLREHGYQRRTASLKAYLKQCMFFYHIETYIRGGEPCDIEDIYLDDMITFRVLQNVRPFIIPESSTKDVLIDDKKIPDVKVGEKVITVSLGELEKHIVLTHSKLELGHCRVEFGKRKFMVSLNDGAITEI